MYLRKSLFETGAVAAQTTINLLSYVEDMTEIIAIEIKKKTETRNASNIHGFFCCKFAATKL